MTTHRFQVGDVVRFSPATVLEVVELHTDGKITPLDYTVRILVPKGTTLYCRYYLTGEEISLVDPLTAALLKAQHKEAK